MIEPKPTGFVRQKMNDRTAAPGTARTTREQAIAARRKLYEATVQIDAIIKARLEPDALQAALMPFLQAAEILTVRTDDAK